MSQTAFISQHHHSLKEYQQTYHHLSYAHYLQGCQYLAGHQGQVRQSHVHTDILIFKIALQPKLAPFSAGTPCRTMDRGLKHRYHHAT